MSTTPSGRVSPDTRSGLPLAPECQAPDTIPTFITPSAPPPIPPVWEYVIAVFMKLPPTTAEGQNMRAWVTYHSLTSLEDFLMWELDTLQYDAITVCFPSRDTIQPNSLVSLKPISIRHLIMLRKYLLHLVQDSHVSVSSDTADHATPLFTSSCPGNSMRPPPHLLHPHLQSLPLTPEAVPHPPLAPVNS